MSWSSSENAFLSAWTQLVVRELSVSLRDLDAKMVAVDGASKGICNPIKVTLPELPYR